MAYPVGQLIDLVSGVLFVLLGGWVASLRPRTPLNRAYAVFAMVFGLGTVVRNIVLGDPATDGTFFLVGSIVSTGAGIAAIVLAARAAGSRAPGARRALTVATLAGMAVVVFTAADATRIASPSRALAVGNIANVGEAGGLLAAGLFVAWLAAGATISERERMRHALLSLGLVAYPTLGFGTFASDLVITASYAAAIAAGALLAGTMALALLAARRATAPHVESSASSS